MFFWEIQDFQNYNLEWIEEGAVFEYIILYKWWKYKMFYIVIQ